MLGVGGRAGRKVVGVRKGEGRRESGGGQRKDIIRKRKRNLQAFAV